MRQQHSWDCGLACCSMILRALGHATDLAALYRSAPARSLWTIDLAYMLTRRGVACRMTTANPGVADYEHETFYKATLPEDSHRVRALFEGAENFGVDVEHRSLTSTALQAMVRPRDSVTMALVVRSAHLAPAHSTHQGAPHARPVAPHRTSATCTASRSVRSAASPGASRGTPASRVTLFW